MNISGASHPQCNLPAVHSHFPSILPEREKVVPSHDVTPLQVNFMKKNSLTLKKQMSNKKKLICMSL